MTMKKSKNKHLLLSECINERVESKRLMKKNSTADLYLVAGHHFLNFIEKNDILLPDITPTMVCDLQTYLQTKELKINTLNSYLSSLRAVFNAVLNDRPFKIKKHPFQHMKLKRDVTVKKPLSPDMIGKIATADFSNDPRLSLGADLSLFSFMAYGMPFVDMIRLKNSNIQGNKLVYNRHKTGIQIRIGITLGMMQIIEKYRNKGEYLFPVMFPEATYRQYKGMLAAHNQSLKTIGKELEIHSNLTSYVLRRTWAAEAQRCHTPISVINQALRHTSEKTTRCYLNQLDQSELNDANRTITSFINRILIKNVKGDTRKGTYYEISKVPGKNLE